MIAVGARAPLGAARALVAPALAALLLSAAGGCGGCSKTTNDASHAADGGIVVLADGAIVALPPPPLDPSWAHAEDSGLPEDLANVAVAEGAAGLVEALDDPPRRAIAIRAMGYAHGWAQLPALATIAAGKDDDEARDALASAVMLAARPRDQEDPEDAEELEEGCKAFAALAGDTKKAKERRIPAVRAVRMMPCPKVDLPSDVDAR